MPNFTMVFPSGCPATHARCSRRVVGQRLDLGQTMDQVSAVRRRLLPAAIAAAILVGLLPQWAPAGIMTIYSDNFSADTLGSVPVIPQVGQPWQTSATTPGGIQVVSDPLFATNGLELGSYRSTIVMPFAAADQATMAANGNLTLSFQYDGISSQGFTPFLDISGINTSTGMPAFLYRIMSQQTAPGSGLHEIYYLSPSSGLTDTGLAIASDSLQTLSISANFAGQTSQLSVGSNTATLPLYTCPSMIQEASLSSYMIGSGGVSATNLDDIAATTSDADPASPALTTQPSNQLPTPEPAALVLLLAALAGPAAWSMWRRGKAAKQEVKP